MVFGIVGGVLGVIFSLLFIFFGGPVVAIFDKPAGLAVATLGICAFFIAVVGIAGGALANTNPKLSSIFLLLCGALGFWAIGIFWALPGVLFFSGSILEYISEEREEKPNRAPATDGIHATQKSSDTEEIAKRLETLADLHMKGIINQDEYEMKKKELLSKL